jgi:hypothetical protein
VPGAAQELVIGPFSAGINQFSDKSSIADNEVEDCINFDVDLDGSLKSRSPWQLLYGLSTPVTIGFPEQYQIILGTYVYNGVRFILFHTRLNGSATTAIVQVYYVDGPNAGTTANVGTGDGTFSTSIRYEDTIYIIPAPGSSTGGYSYNLTSGVVTPIPTMPKGNAAVVYKDTLYIGGGNTTNKSRLYFSALATFTSWPGTNFFDINPGDGDTLQDFLIYQDNILLAKDNATYVLAYDTSPAQAVLKNINTSVGVKGPHCMLPYENSIFFLQYSTVFEMINYDFARVSTKLPFELDNIIPRAGTTAVNAWQFPVSLSRVGDRLVIRYYNRLYVYHLRIKAWTRWESNDPNIQGIGPIFELDRTNAANVQGWGTYVACSGLNNVMDATGHGTDFLFSKIFKFEDNYDGTSVENGDITPAATPITIDCSILTKQYDIGISHRFKRLLHWGVDMVTANDVTGTLFPLSMAYRVKWSQLAQLTWNDLLTWGYPLFENPSFTQVTPIVNRVDRRFIRFPKSLRFRLLQFEIQVSTLGNTTDGPARLYTITAFIASKELVPEAVN